jgi:hypothetical protein
MAAALDRKPFLAGAANVLSLDQVNIARTARQHATAAEHEMRVVRMHRREATRSPSEIAELAVVRAVDVPAGRQLDG